MRRSVFTPVGFSKSRIRSGKGLILLECGVENFDGVLYVFGLDVVLQVTAPLQIEIVRRGFGRAVSFQSTLLLRLQLQFQRLGSSRHDRTRGVRFLSARARLP